VDTTAQAAVPGLVPDARLDGANARLMIAQVVGNDAVGAPIGALLATIGSAALIGPSAVLYLAAAVAATRLRLPSRARHRSAVHDLGVVVQVRGEVAAGLRYLLDEPVLRRLALANALSNLGNTAFAAVFVVFVVAVLELPAVTYGGFLVALAGGGLAGGVLAERVLRRTGSGVGIRGGFAVAVLCYAAVALTRDPVVVGVIAAVLGAASMVVNVAARTLRQRLVPATMLGRVTASMAAVALVATPIGAVAGGVVAQWLGVATVGWFAAVTNLVALLLLRVGGSTADRRCPRAHVASSPRGGPAAGHHPRPGGHATVDMKLELIFVPVTDVDRAKAFYADQVGFVVDHDHRVSDDLRFVQLTPPGSTCSIAIGEGITDMAAGSQWGLQMVVDDVRALRKDLVARGVEASEVAELAWGHFVEFDDPDGNRWALQQLPAPA
jgi:catechol 2,3-dioxygenase-like lactoylglutathione lyase family enzyme/predicted MFS family arabinose efflux permease